MLYFYILIAVQVVLESVPVSSSAHLQLLEHCFEVYASHITVPQVFSATSFLGEWVTIDTIAHILHGPTVVVVAVFFYTRWVFLITNLRRCFFIILKTIFLVGITDCVTSIFFLLFKIFSITMPLGVGLSITAGVLYSLRWCDVQVGRRFNRNIFDWRIALVLGIAQGFALMPGFSRFAAVYVGARWLGLAHRKSFEVTWLVQWPLILLAFAHGVYATGTGTLFDFFYDPMLTAVVFGASLLAFLLLYVVELVAARGYLWLFSFYMIVPFVLWCLL